MNHKIICALDTGSLDVAIETIKRLSPAIGAFKIGHGLTLPYGLDVIPRLQDAGATRIFLDLKFHDIPNSVAIAVREAAKRDVWMLTVHLSGGLAMLSAAAEEAKNAPDRPPLIMGVSVLTSIDLPMLNDQLGVKDSIESHMTKLSQLGMMADIDGVITSAQEVKHLRSELGREAILVTPGIRLCESPLHDQVRVGSASQALADGADYLVIGRALTEAADPERVVEELRLLNAV